MAEVSLRDVRKSYGDTEVIHGVSCEIADGEFVVVVGPSGCGKSTLLRMVAGLEEISRGEIAIGGRVVNRVEPKDRDIAMVFQNYALYPHMSVFDNMAYGLKIRRLGRAEIGARVAKAAEILQLGELLQRKPRQLSGGQRQRVAMGRAIVRDPQVFLFDEPLSNLDAKLRVQMRAEIKSLCSRLDTTTIYVTHDQVEAMTMADKIVVLNGGRIEQAGPPLELYDKPRNMFVAGFLGSPAMNFFRAEVSDGCLRLENGAQLAANLPHHVSTGSRLVAGIRPEDFVIDPDGPVNAEIKLVEPTGSDTVIAVEIADTEAVVVVRERFHTTADEILRLSVDPDRIHLFDPETDGVL
jgi:multiple sugar transport system ATP-binding protein